MRSDKAIVVLACTADAVIRPDRVAQTLREVRALHLPVLISSRQTLSSALISLADYCLIEHAVHVNGKRTPPQGELLRCYRNALDFCRGRFAACHLLSAELAIDIAAWLGAVAASEQPLACVRHAEADGAMDWRLCAGRIDLLDRLLPPIEIEGHPAPGGGTGDGAMPDDLASSVEWIRFAPAADHQRPHVAPVAPVQDVFNCHFVDGPFLEIAGDSGRPYDVFFGNPHDGPEYYRLEQKPGMWARADKRFFREWTIEACFRGERLFSHRFSAAGRRVLISMGSKSLGDTIAWMPYVEEFRARHGCTVYCSTWWNELFDYPDIHFIQPGDRVEDLYASYEIGCYDERPDRNPVSWRLVPLQQVAADILGLDYRPIRARLKQPPRGGGSATPYMCFSEFSTMQAKLWNRPGAWQNIVDHAAALGYECISISAEPSELRNVTRHNARPIADTVADIRGAAFFVGLNSGPAWLAWALDVPCVMITGVTEPWSDFPNPYRVDVDACRPGCFNDPALPMDRKWEWCPRSRDFACTREITEAMVIARIDQARQERQLP